MTEKKDESRLRELLSVFNRLDYKELLEILHRDQKRYHEEKLRLPDVVSTSKCEHEPRKPNKKYTSCKKCETHLQMKP